MRQTRHQVSRTIRRLLVVRAQARCEMCGQQLNQNDLHHRVQRSVGGQDDPSNLVVLHRRCHDLIHDHLADAVRYGWVVPSHQDPRNIPVHMFDGDFYLTDLGTREAELP